MKRRFSLSSAESEGPDPWNDMPVWWRRPSMWWSVLVAFVLHGVLLAVLGVSGFLSTSPKRKKRKIVLIRRVIRQPKKQLPRRKTPPRPRIRKKPVVRKPIRRTRRPRRRIRRRKRARRRRSRRRRRAGRRSRKTTRPKRKLAQKPVQLPTARKLTKAARSSKGKQSARQGSKGTPKLDVIGLMPSLSQKQKRKMADQMLQLRGGKPDKKGQRGLASILPKYHIDFKRRLRANRGLYDRFYENIADVLRLCIRRHLPHIIKRYNKMYPQGKRQSKGFQHYTGTILLAWNADGKLLYPIIKQKRKVSPLDNDDLRKQVRHCLKAHWPPKHLLGKKTLRARWRFNMVVGVTQPTLVNLISLITMWKTIAQVRLWTEAIY